MIGWLRFKSTRGSGYFNPLQAKFRDWRGALGRSFAHRREVSAWVSPAFSNSFLVAGISITGAAAVLFLVPILTSPFYWLPEPKDSLSLLGPLLGAQAAVAALTLAVTVFVVQGVSNKDDADDRTYREYVRRSRAEWVLWSSLGAAAITATVLVGHRLITGTPAVLEAGPGLANLTLVAVAALFGNLVLPGLLFRHAVRLARPDEWRALRLDVDKRDIRAAVQAFLERSRRAAAALEAGEPDLSNFFPDLGEDAASEAIRAVLGDARRAMAERRYGEFTHSLASIRKLVEYAMDELEHEGVRWDQPGSQPQWPPLHSLGGDLYSFREEVIGRGDRDYVFQVLNLDYWLLSNGMRRECGEMFAAALEGYRWNYEIACRVGSGELRELLRDQVWQVANGLILTAKIDEALPYLSEMVKHQERLAAHAMSTELPEDYERLHDAFQQVLRAVQFHRDVRDTDRADPARPYQQLVQAYRVALMGLGGRAVLRAESGTIADPNPYLDVPRAAANDLRRLADDVGKALSGESDLRSSVWLEWEREGARNLQMRSVKPEQYPLAFFALRLLELVTDDTPPLNLHGHARQVFGWFEQNSGRIAPYVAADPDRDMEERQGLVTAALTDAIRADEVAQDQAIISWQLSEERLSAFTAGIYAGTFSNAGIEEWFRRASAYLYISAGAEDGPAPRWMSELLPKASLADVPENSHTYYAPLEGEPLGERHPVDTIYRICEELDEAPTVRTLLDTPQALLQAIDEASEALAPSGKLLVMLAGDCSDVLAFPHGEEPVGYEPWWRIPSDERSGEMARYRGCPLLSGPDHGERRLYVVEPGAWGCFVRAQVEGDRDLLVEVNPISTERARVLLEASPELFDSEPDEESRLRKIRTFVDVVVAARTEFRVSDPSRALRIMHVESPA